MIKVHKNFKKESKMDFPFKSYDKKLVFLRRMGTCKKNLSFPINAVDFCKTFCTCSINSLRQDLMVKIAKRYTFFSFGLLEPVLNVFREKMPLFFRS